MLKRTILLLTISCLSFNLFAIDEGMWLPLLLKRLNETDMQKLGLKLTADEIYSVNNSSLKDAIVNFGGFCTAEVISNDGLLITNHHCGFEAVQAHSSPEHDYITDGFWAMSRDQELNNEGLTATFLIRMEDVTDRVIKELNDTLTEAQRSAKVAKISGTIADEATKGTGYHGEVKSFFYGNEYYLFVYETFKDIRLVGAPPSSIGKFGGDTDNWMWPRHTGDFSMFRIYCGKDGKPAEYSKDNVPYKPKKALTVSIAGYKPNDFAMTFGYPGGTTRFMTSYGIGMQLDQTAPSVVQIRDKKLKIMKEYMDLDNRVRIKYAAKYAETANYWKFYIGQIRELNRRNLGQERLKEEAEFKKWALADPQRTKKYGDLMTQFDSIYKEYRKYNLSKNYINEAIFQGPEIFPFAFQFQDLAGILDDPKHTADDLNKTIEELKKGAKEHFKDYNLPTDKKMLAAMMKMYHQNIPTDQQSDIFDEINSKYAGDFDKYADAVFSKSIFRDSTSVADFLAKPNLKALKKDLAYRTVNSLREFYIAKIRLTLRGLEAKMNRANRAYIAGLRQMHPDKKYYPDANFTMRLSYGTVQDYDPMDAVHYNYFTTLDGVMDKEDSTNEEFIVPAKLKQLYKAKDYGRYADHGTMNVCFTTNNDITGGNSGSPVLNGKGELIGLAFDANWESMSGDISFEPSKKRCINVDIRYCLFIIDKYAGAQNLLKEMTISDKPVGK